MLVSGPALGPSFGLFGSSVSVGRSAQSLPPKRAWLAWATIDVVVQPTTPAAESRQSTNPSPSSSYSSDCSVALGIPVPPEQSLFQPSHTSGLDGCTLAAACIQLTGAPVASTG